MALSMVLVLVGTLTLMASAQNLGDIRLTGNGATSTAGRLEVFYGDFGWGTVNYKSLDENFANVACQQLGYGQAVSLGLAIKTQYGIGNTTWILLNGSRCTGSEIHVMRCYWKNMPCLHCSHEDDTAIECSSTSIWSSPYAGQVRLRGSLPSQGIAEIYIKGQWESICYDNVQSFVADSVCRQLGYTNSKEIGISQTYSAKAWLRNFNCNESQPCFTYCFNNNNRNEGCNRGQLNVSCEFKLNGALDSGGSSSICTIRSSGNDSSGNDSSGNGMSCTTITAINTIAAFTPIIAITPTQIVISTISATTTSSESPSVTCVPDKGTAKSSLLSKKTLSIILGSLGGVCCGLCTLCVICYCRRRYKIRPQKRKYPYQSIR